MRVLVEHAIDGVVYATGKRNSHNMLCLHKYLHEMQCTGQAIVKYRLKSGEKLGRYYTETGGVGLQNFPSEVRKHLAQRFYYDVDFKNAHPVLMQQLCQKLLIVDTPQLEKYIQNRDDYLEQVQSLCVPACSRDIAKNLFICIIFGGSRKTWMHEHRVKIAHSAELLRFIDAFTGEIQRIMLRVFCARELAHFHSLIKKRSEQNVESRFLSIVLQTIESECLQTLDETLSALGWSMDTLIFDGGLVRRREHTELSREVLQFCERAIFEKTNYNLSLEIKSLQPEIELEQLIVEAQASCAKTDSEAMQLLHKLEGENWRSVDSTGIYVYDVETGLWTQRDAAFYELMMRQSEQLGAKYSAMLRRMKDVMELCKCKNIVDSSWTLRFNRLQAGLVPFANGIYDVTTSTLRDFEREDMITTKFEIDAPTPNDNFDTEFADVVHIIETLLPEMQLRREVMKRAADSFFSCTNTHKYFVQLYGEGDNGKTTLLRILQTAFPQWVKMPSVENLVCRGTPRNPDASQPWLMDVIGARLLGFEEPGDGCAFDGALLKQLRGNGVVTARNLYKNNVSQVPGFTLWIAANDPIEIKPMDAAVLNSLDAFRMPSYFTDCDLLSAHLQGVHHKYVYKKIPDLQNRFEQRNYKLALLKLLAQYYSEYCEEGLQSLHSEYSLKALYTQEHPSIEDRFDLCFEVDKYEKVTAARIYQVMQLHGYKESKKKLTIWLDEHFKGNALVRSNKPRNVRTWIGLRVRDDFMQM